jgi:hypothetical protein
LASADFAAATGEENQGAARKLFLFFGRLF